MKKSKAPEIAPPEITVEKKPRKKALKLPLAELEPPPPPVMAAPRKSTADILREALAAKQAGTSAGAPRLRPQMGGGKVAKDAERRIGKSRKVH